MPSITGRYCKLLERKLWAEYRRGSEAAFTPLLVTLPGCKDPAKSAVDEHLREVRLESLSKLQSAATGAGRRRWLIILDGYDEVQGTVNFVVGNKLHECPRVKVNTTMLSV